MRSFIFLAVLAIAASAVAGQTQFQVNNGNQCVAAKMGDCVPVTVDGTQSYVLLHRFERGELNYYSATDSSCATVVDSTYTTAAPCSSLSPGHAAPSTFNALHVSSAHPLTLMVLGDDDDHHGAAFMNITNGVVAGALPYFAFHADAGTVRFIEQYDDGSYLTSAGLCQIGASCSMNGFTVSMETISFDNLSNLSRPLAHVASYFTAGVSTDYVLVYLGRSYAVGSSNENAYIFTRDGFLVSPSALETVLSSVPPHVSVTNMQLKNADQPRPSLVSKISYSDFETYASTPCYQNTGDLSFLGYSSSDTTFHIAECEFSFSFSLDLSELFSDFFFSFSLLEEEEKPATFEEVPAFALFE